MKEVISLKFNSIKDSLPPNDASVIVQMNESVSGKTKLAGAYFDRGVFWDSRSNDACGVEVSSHSYNEETNECDILEYDWKVAGWCKAD